MPARRPTLNLLETAMKLPVLLLVSLCLIGAVVPTQAISAPPEGDFSRTTIDIGIMVADIERSVGFYTKAVGFKEVRGFQATGQFTGDAGLTDHKDVKVRVLVLGDGPTATRLKLLEIPLAIPKTGDNQFIHSQFGFRYLTIGVNDMTAAVARLEKAGVKPLGKCPLALPSAVSSNGWLTVFRDPDGNVLEFVGPKK